MLIRGTAGSGKTTLMKEAVAAVERGGHRVFTFAPSADASRGVLRGEGFATADTVARLLVDTKLQAETRGQVLWIDEAGLLGSKAMRQVFDLAGRLDCRVILSGDRKQHGAVERGAVLKVLETQAGLPVAEVREIQRQHGAYKDAVALLADGRTEDGFDRLDALGWVKEVPTTERYQQLADDYVAAVGEGKTALVVSPTHAEGAKVTAAVRTTLRTAGTLSGDDHALSALTRVDLTEAQRGVATNYRAGDVLQFHQNAKGFKAGDRLTVTEGSAIPVEQAGRFQVFRPADLRVAVGDRLRITKGGQSKDGHKLENGSVYAVRGFTTSGDVRLANGWVVGRDFGHLAHGYVTTSHASQGKTVDRVFIGQSGESWGAASKEQFYVSASRGRQSVTVYTDDKLALREAIGRTEDRPAAVELVQSRQHLHRQRVRLHRAVPRTRQSDHRDRPRREVSRD